MKEDLNMHVAGHGRVHIHADGKRHIHPGRKSEGGKHLHKDGTTHDHKTGLHVHKDGTSHRHEVKDKKSTLCLDQTSCCPADGAKAACCPSCGNTACTCCGTKTPEASLPEAVPTVGGGTTAPSLGIQTLDLPLLTWLRKFL